MSRNVHKRRFSENNKPLNIRLQIWRPGKLAGAVTSAISIAKTMAPVAALQQGLLSLSHPKQTLEESTFNVGAATLVSGILDAAGEINRGPLANAAAALVDEGAHR